MFLQRVIDNFIETLLATYRVSEFVNQPVNQSKYVEKRRLLG